MSEKTIVLITGANRGIGKGLLSVFLSRPNTTVIAGVRDPSAVSKALSSIPTAHGSTVITVQINSTSTTDAKSAIEHVTSIHGIHKLDIVIANAGIANYLGLAAEAPIEQVQEHFNVNTIGPLVLFQATLPLLQAAPQPKFVVISSRAGSISLTTSSIMKTAAYGPSKAAVNFLVNRIHNENEGLIAFSICPGWVQTEMGEAVAKSLGVEKAQITVEDSVDGILKRIDVATREDTSGKFFLFDGSEVPW